MSEPSAPTPVAVKLPLLFVALSLVTLLVSMSQHLFVPALPEIAAEFGKLSQMSWIIVAFMLASIPTMPIFGKLSDHFGRRSMILFGIGLFTAGSLLGALAPGMGWLITARVLQGIGSGALVILPLAAVADIVPARQRGLYAGILSTVFAASSIAGPFVGGLLTQGPGWRWGFWLNVPVGVIAALGCFFLLKLPKPQSDANHRLDVAGMALISIAITALALVTTWGGVDYVWTSLVIQSISAVGVLSIMFLPWIERRAQNPVLPLELFRERDFVLTSLSSIALAMVMFTFLGYLPTFVQISLGAGAAEGGLVMIPMAVGTLIGSTVAGQIVSRTGRYKMVLVVAALIVSAGVVVMAVTVHDSAFWLAAASGGIVGVGLGASFGNIVIIVQNAFAHAILGVATAATSLFRQIGGMFGTSLVGAMYIRGWSSNLERDLSSEELHTVGSSPSPELIGQLPPSLRETVVTSYNDAMLPIYVLMAVMALMAAMVTLMLKPKVLSETIDA